MLSPTQAQRGGGAGGLRSPGAGGDGAHGGAAPSSGHGPPLRRAGAGALALGALGVVFGDIGTSPLYTMQAVFAGGRISAGAGDVEGVVSLVLWTLTLIVSVKYVTFVMRADSHGEGGVMALIARVQSLGPGSARMGAALVAAGVFGVALFIGDGMITPAISVLSAVEGVRIAAPGVGSVVVPVTVAILGVLFAVQRFGTAAVARFFGPVMAVWFAALALLGLVQVVGHPSILRAVSPTYGLAFLSGHPGSSFIALGAIVLAVTGAEALYADMGHFGRAPIRRAWFWLVFPALALNYLGQGSLVLATPAGASNPFYLLVPGWGRTPMVILATAATVIASQALISGTFSVARQAVGLGFLPRLTIVHTSDREIGQVYVPAINALLVTGVVAIVVLFGSAQRLASAYGLAVTGTFVITSALFLVVARGSLGWTLRRTVVVGTLLVTVNLAFLAANLTKIASGGWVPLAIALGAFTVLTTWHRGSVTVERNRALETGPLGPYVDHLGSLRPPLLRLPGTGVFLSSDAELTPLAMTAQVGHAHALHDQVIVLTVVIEQRAHVPVADRIVIGDLSRPGRRVLQVTERYGFKDRLDVPGDLRLAVGGLAIDLSDPTYYLSRMSLVPTSAAGMPRWRKRLFLAIAKNAADPAEYFALPDDRVVILGARVPI